jgi:hypothetical protein
MQPKKLGRNPSCIVLQVSPCYGRIMTTHRGTQMHTDCGLLLARICSNSEIWLDLSFLTSDRTAFSLQAASPSSMDPLDLRYCNSLFTLAVENMYFVKIFHNICTKEKKVSRIGLWRIFLAIRKVRSFGVRARTFTCLSRSINDEKTSDQLTNNPCGFHN